MLAHQRRAIALSREPSMSRHAAKEPSQRQLRVGEEIRHALSTILLRGDLHDPDLADASITVSEVRVSPDLKHATAFIMPLGGDHKVEALAGLRRAAPFLRGQVARAVRLKFAPSLRFEVDDRFDRAQRIDALLDADRPAVSDDRPADDPEPGKGRGPGDGP